MKCIVLSGATVPFVELVKSVDQLLAEKLHNYGFDQIEVQYGYAVGAFNSSVRQLTGFDFDPRIKNRVDAAQLVISHAGSGSILDAVERGHGLAGRKVIVVVNSQLMDNHQLELALKLESEGCVLVCRDPSQLEKAVDNAMNRNFQKLRPAASLQPILDELLKEL